MTISYYPVMNSAIKFHCEIALLAFNQQVTVDACPSFPRFSADLKSLGALVFLLSYFLRISVKCLKIFFQNTWICLELSRNWSEVMKKISCMVPEFSMFFEKLACMNQCSMENFQADSTRVKLKFSSRQVFLKKSSLSTRIPLPK